MKKLYLILFGLGLIYILYLNKEIFYKYPKGVRNTISLSNKSQKAEFEKVLEYFKKDENELKLKSAQVLINNLPLYSYEIEPKVFNSIVDSVNKIKLSIMDDSKDLKYNQRMLKKTRDSFLLKMNTIYKTNQSLYKKEVRDIDTLSSSFLIENINLAFEAQKRLPKKYQTNFNDFCNYVLPYRNAQEPLEFHKRKELYQKYSWVYDSIKTNSIESVVSTIYNDLRINIDFIKLSKLGLNPTYSQIEKLQYGLCRDVTNYFVYLFRALGFAAGTDYITSYGNRYSVIGHNWFFIIYDNTFIPIQARSESLDFNNTDKVFKLTSMPKVYRNVFNKINYKDLSINKDIDVTSMYRPTSQIGIENTLGIDDDENYKLCVFNQNLKWFEVDKKFIKKRNTILFNNVGRGILYVVVNGESNPINAPFYLDYNGKITFLRNNDFKKQIFKATRKYPPIDLPNNWKIDRQISLNNCKIQGSNSLEDESFIDIHIIKNFRSTHKQKILFVNEQNYKYYRFVKEENTRVHLAEFKLLGKDLKPLKKVKINFSGKKSLSTKKKLEKNITDNNSLTYAVLKETDINLEVEKDLKVKGFEIQARNDDNHINVGEKYELKVFDNKWKSIKIEIAKDTVLNYDNIAKNGLYLLRNLTKGKEETVFTFDKNGKQFWFGVSDIKELGAGVPLSIK